MTQAIMAQAQRHWGQTCGSGRHVPRHRDMCQPGPGGTHRTPLEPRPRGTRQHFLGSALICFTLFAQGEEQSQHPAPSKYGAGSPHSHQTHQDGPFPPIPMCWDGSEPSAKRSVLGTHFCAGLSAKRHLRVQGGSWGSRLVRGGPHHTPQQHRDQGPLSPGWYRSTHTTVSRFGSTGAVSCPRCCRSQGGQSPNGLLGPPGCGCSPPPGAMGLRIPQAGLDAAPLSRTGPPR